MYIQEQIGFFLEGRLHGPHGCEGAEEQIIVKIRDLLCQAQHTFHTAHIGNGLALDGSARIRHGVSGHDAQLGIVICQSVASGSQRHFASMWTTQTSYQKETELFRDVHPLGFLRTNVTLQQFEKFYETYGIEPGDGMYLAPEDRILVW